MPEGEDSKVKIIFLGVQGSGKSTQAKLAAEKLGLPYIEMGQLFRDKKNNNDEDAEKIRETIDKGILVPDELATRTLKQRLASPDCIDGYVLDGYPRNDAQFGALDKDIDKVFNIKISDEEAIKRLLLRGRYDDTKESLQKRMEWHHSLTEPLIARFREIGILEDVDGKRTVEEVTQDIENRIHEIKK